MVFPRTLAARFRHVVRRPRENPSVDRRLLHHSKYTKHTMLCSSFSISQLAIPAVCVLITFLAYSSQYLFLYIEPAPLTKDELLKFNALVACIWICYYRACTVDPGRIPKDWKPARKEDEEKAAREGSIDATVRQRWCRRCEAFKPPRAHHCKTCQRLVVSTL